MHAKPIRWTHLLAFVLLTLGATGALVAAGLHETELQTQSAQSADRP